MKFIIVTIKVTMLQKSRTSIALFELKSAGRLSNAGRHAESDLASAYAKFQVFQDFFIISEQSLCTYPSLRSNVLIEND